MNTKLIILIIIIALALGALYYFFIFQKTDVSINPAETIEGEAEGLGSELYQNPGSIVPETNPFNEVKTNPLQGINPFGDGYKNPFE